MQEGSVPSPVQLGFGFTPYSPLLFLQRPAAHLPGAALRFMAMGKKTGRGGFWEEEINGYQWCDRKVSWRKERSGLREHGSDNGLDRVKEKKKDRKFTFVTGEKEEARKGDEMGEDTVKLTARRCEVEEGNFFLQNMQMGLTAMFH